MGPFPIQIKKNGSGPSQHYPCNNVPTLYASLVKIWKYQTVTPFVLNECISICVEEYFKSNRFELKQNLNFDQETSTNSKICIFRGFGNYRMYYMYIYTK